ncbi:MAG TPA: hypothetical protein VK559_09895 [Ferruginibacter sp.]|nr:hypothetical protein [Ferruginibacter sp.]
MKKIVVSMIALGCFILSATAQDQMDKGHFQHQKDMVIKQLNLTPDQQQKLQASREDFKAQMIALNQDESITLKDYRDKIYILRKEQKMQFLHILTADQKAKLEQIKKDNQAKRELIASKRIELLQLQLNLSNEQVAAIKANREAEHSKLETIVQNDSLSRTDKKEQLMTIKEANKDSMKTVLTADQYAKWQELKKERMEKMQNRMSGGIAQ